MPQRRRARSRSLLQSPPTSTESRRIAVWILTGISTVFILVGWVFFFRRGIFEDLSKGGAFKTIEAKIKKEIRGVQTDVDLIKKFSRSLRKTLPETEGHAEELRIQMLEQKAFPQFETTNE